MLGGVVSVQCVQLQLLRAIMPPIGLCKRYHRSFVEDALARLVLRSGAWWDLHRLLTQQLLV